MLRNEGRTSLHRCRWRPQGFVCVCMFNTGIYYTCTFKGSSACIRIFMHIFPIVCKQVFSTFKHLIYFNYLHAYYWNEANSLLRNFSSFSSSSQPLLPSSIASLCEGEAIFLFSKRRTEKETWPSYSIS